MKLSWTVDAVADRVAIYDYIEDRNDRAAIMLDMMFSQYVASLPGRRFMGQTGRVSGTRELRVHRQHLLVYDMTDTEIRILRLLHAARRWPQHEGVNSF